MMDHPSVQDWFNAALLHDLGKTHDWGRHADWSTLPYASTDALKRLAELAREHHESVSPTSNLDDITLLKLADRLQKGLYAHPHAQDFEARPRPPAIAAQAKQLLDAPVFQPYYGNAVTWDASRRTHLKSEIRACLRNDPTFENLLRLQREKLDTFPHTTYIPHLALGLHQQITAALFYFLRRRARRNNLTQASQLQSFTLYAFTITPEPLAFFSRLRYLDAYREAAEKLRAHLFAEIFHPILSEGLTFTEQFNPFQFFDGSSLALLYDDDQSIVDSLQSYLDKPDTLLDSIEAQIHSYRLKEWGVHPTSGKLFAGASNIDRAVRHITILPARATRFAGQTETRCMNCGAATPADELTTLGTRNLCATCAQVERQKGVLNLKKFCPEGYLGWVFLAFQAPLLDAAVEQAQAINDEVAAQTMIPPGYLTPSATGFDEYFQALTHMQEFQAKCDRQIQTLGQGARRLAHFTHLAIYLLCEDNYWKFLAFLNQERKQLRIPTSLRAFLCNAHYPVWSLMERGAEFDPQKRDLYYHIAQGSVAMFTSTDVNTIRSLATLASAQNVNSTQLSSLVNVALRTTAPELFLEIDVKAREGKLGRGGFAGKLKEGLAALQADDDFGGREKRAIFIKYIRKLRGEDRR